MLTTLPGLGAPAPAHKITPTSGRSMIGLLKQRAALRWASRKTPADIALDGAAARVRRELTAGMDRDSGLGITERTCPDCGEPMQYEPASLTDRCYGHGDTRTERLPAGWACCGHWQEGGGGC